MINSTVGHTYGDAAYHREQRCNQDCNQGRECDCRRPDIADIAIRDENILDLKQEVEILIMQRDELVAAAKEAIEYEEDGDWQSAMHVLITALAKIEGAGE